MTTSALDVLRPEDRDRLAAGHHAEVAAELLERGESVAAASVFEQIWDWDSAWAAYLRAGKLLDALRVALESGRAPQLDHAIAALESDRQPEPLAAAIALLKRKRRPLEAARLQALLADPRARAQSLLEGGDRLAAASVLAEHAQAQEAFEIMRHGGRWLTATPLGLMARLAWDLGDAEAAARYAQHSLRSPVEPGTSFDRQATEEVLARALVALGHDLAAQIALHGRELPLHDTGVPGRYRIHGTAPAGLVGAAYVGFDRVTLEEVEVHLLLAETADGGPLEPALLRALERFAATAEAAAKLAHPAIRPILRLDPQAGLLVLPRAEGPNLRTLVRPPGMVALASRTRALLAFLLEGLQTAHAHGLVHGWLLPSQIACDAAGRPMLGPFGAHHLAGLAATRTGSLEEIMLVTAPELRAGGSPQVESDIYAAGAILRALLCGSLEADPQVDETLTAVPEFKLADRMLALSPRDRPSAEEVLAILRSPIADVRELETTPSDPSRPGTKEGADPASVVPGIAVTVDLSWTEAELDALCRSATPWMQPILDREDRSLRLAAWPEGCHTLGEAIDGWQELLPGEAFHLEDEGLQAALRARLRPTSLVRTPCGQWMLALDDLLTR